MPTEYEFQAAVGQPSNDLLTLTGIVSTASQGDFLVCRLPQTSADEKFVIEQDGTIQKYKVNVQALSTGSTAITMSASQSGGIFLFGVGASGFTVTLPAVQDGLWFEFYAANMAQTASGFYIKAPSTGTVVAFNDSAADGIGIQSSALSIGGAVQFFSDGSKWYTHTLPAFSSASYTSAAGGTVFQVVS